MTTALSLHHVPRALRLSLGLGLASIGLSAVAQTPGYLVPTYASVAGWASNNPIGTRAQDLYHGTRVTGQPHDTSFLSAGADQAVYGGLEFLVRGGYSAQQISGLTTTSLAAAETAGQYLEFPFTTASPATGNGTAPAVSFYLNSVQSRFGPDMFNSGQTSQFGFAAYLYDSAGSRVGDLLGGVANVDSVVSTADGYSIFSAPVGSADARNMAPGAGYSVRVYLYRTPATATSNAPVAWDDFFIQLSRSTAAELSVTATPVTATPSGTGNAYAYTFSVYNNGPDAGTAGVNDPLPGAPGASGASWTCVLTNPSAACATPNGTGPIASVQEPLAVGQTATYTINWTGAAPAADDTHTISIAPATGSPADPITTNNSASVTVPGVAAVAVPLGGAWWVLLSSLGLAGMVARRRVRR